MILTSTGELGEATRNDLLYEFRLNYQSDRWATVSEWLFQLARHWALWQDERIGTFPMDYRDPSGPADRASAESSGEDHDYYVIDDIIRTTIEEHGARTWSTDEGWSWMDRLDSNAGDYVQDLLVHTTRVLIRLYHLLDAAGESY